MNLAPYEHHALQQLARHGQLPLGQGSDAVPTSAAIRLAMAGMATLERAGDEQIARLTRQGRAFNHRVVR